MLVLALAGSSPLAAQGIAASVQGQFGSPTRVQYSLGWLTPHWSLFEAGLGAAWIHGDDGDRFGGQLELVIGQRNAARWYGVASIAGGTSSGGAESPWGGWSAGLGWRALRVGATDLSLEGRYLHLWRPDDAFTLGVKVATRWGRKPEPAVPTVPAAPPAATTPSVSTVADAPSIARSAASAAVDAMGTPYLWGGTAANGFDCSGLIQFAYAQAGITLPRRSVDQAKVGRLIPRELDQLEPGDILTFSREPGGPVSHVGLYVGDRRFIHSASGGVRLSLLSEDDPAGKHWVARWVGVRRIG
jgi:cell wall-associated NlpC family hydrolase